MQHELQENRHRIASWHLRTGSGWILTYHMLRLNWAGISLMLVLAVIAAGLFYAPALFMKWFVAHLEVSPDRQEIAWGWVYIVGIFASNAAVCLRTSTDWLNTSTILMRYTFSRGTSVLDSNYYHPSPYTHATKLYSLCEDA